MRFLQSLTPLGRWIFAGLLAPVLIGGTTARSLDFDFFALKLLGVTR